MNVTALECGLLVMGVVVLITGISSRLIRILDGTITWKEKRINKWGISFLFVGLAGIVCGGTAEGGIMKFPPPLAYKVYGLAGVFGGIGIVLMIYYFVLVLIKENKKE